MTTAEVSRDAVLDRYLDVLATEKVTTVERFTLPAGPQPPPLDSVAEVLADPRALFDPPGSSIGPDNRVRRLVVFALWLAEQPAARLGDLGSRAARFRFLVWSMFARFAASPVAAPELEQVSWPGNTLTRTSREMRLAQARAAREDWLGYLDTWEDDAWLSTRHAAGAGALERELAWLTATWPRTGDAGLVPWPAAPTWLDLGSPRTPLRDRYADHRRVAADLTERHWLPGGSVLGAAAAFFPHSRVKRLAMFGYPVLAGVVLVFLAASFDHARWLAAGLAGAGLLAALLLPPRLDALALLRIPAAAAVGEVVLLTLTPHWWVSPGGWLVGLGLLAGAAGYLVLDARLHGIPRWRAAGRGLGIAGLGTLHTAVLSLVVLGLVAPSMAEDGQCLDQWWRADLWAQRPLATVGDCATAIGQHAAAPAGVLVLMTGWSFAFGLAAQILWDDRPVTAPLGRIRRRRGAS